MHSAKLPLLAKSVGNMGNNAYFEDLVMTTDQSPRTPDDVYPELHIYLFPICRNLANVDVQSCSMQASLVSLELNY